MGLKRPLSAYTNDRFPREGIRDTRKYALTFVSFANNLFACVRNDITRVGRASLDKLGRKNSFSLRALTHYRILLEAQASTMKINDIVSLVRALFFLRFHSNSGNYLRACLACISLLIYVFCVTYRLH